MAHKVNNISILNMDLIRDYKEQTVTDYLKQISLDSGTLVYLCGNCDMIYDVYDHLTAKGFPSGSIRTELYG